MHPKPLLPVFPASATALIAAFALLIFTSSASAQTYTILHNFTGAGDGSYPYTGLTMDRGGNLYGTTNLGGQNGYGVVFEITP